VKNSLIALALISTIVGSAAHAEIVTRTPRIRSPQGLGLLANSCQLWTHRPQFNEWQSSGSATVIREDLLIGAGRSVSYGTFGTPDQWFDGELFVFCPGRDGVRAKAGMMHPDFLRKEVYNSNGEYAPKEFGQFTLENDLALIVVERGTFPGPLPKVELEASVTLGDCRILGFGGVRQGSIGSLKGKLHNSTFRLVSGDSGAGTLCARGDREVLAGILIQGGTGVVSLAAHSEYLAPRLAASHEDLLSEAAAIKVSNAFRASYRLNWEIRAELQKNGVRSHLPTICHHEAECANVRSVILQVLKDNPLESSKFLDSAGIVPVTKNGRENALVSFSVGGVLLIREDIGKDELARLLRGIKK
jgi:hypothetical protein